MKHDQERLSRELVDDSLTHYEIETYSSIQQNDYFDPIALEKIKKQQKKSNVH